MPETALRLKRLHPGIYLVLERGTDERPTYVVAPVELLEWEGRRDTTRLRRGYATEMIRWIREAVPGAQVEVVWPEDQPQDSHTTTPRR